LKDHTAGQRTAAHGSAGQKNAGRELQNIKLLISDTNVNK